MRPTKFFMYMHLDVFTPSQDGTLDRYLIVCLLRKDLGVDQCSTWYGEVSGCFLMGMQAVVRHGGVLPARLL